VKIVTYVVLFTFTSLVLATPAWGVGLGTCKLAKTKYQKANAPHIFFPVDTGRLLLKEIKTLRLQKKERAKLIETKLKLKMEQIEWYKTQLKVADTTTQKIAKKVSKLTVKMDKLEQINKNLNLTLAKEKGLKYKYLIWGFGVGFVLAALIGGGVAVAVALK